MIASVPLPNEILLPTNKGATSLGAMERVFPLFVVSIHTSSVRFLKPNKPVVFYFPRQFLYKFPTMTYFGL